ncbi:PstS family phosphate ABC transporter substrate-binding protein [Calothrix sp. 336/3]|uniref:PstS family phosphate ABC transporter substrate-binding protein n=1 Tax=Calothrix sp. 336/3 TaxID=1337936 RepID=UPI0004E4256F|nr:PstS family phosphate ABC transporter substrate-binding protein [Calothrix sp. 336/3]AKG21695.1 ABC transporter substrate-binding protein [Calothrix sp. 336/3]
MNANMKNIAFTLGMLVLATSCVSQSDTTKQTQSSPAVREVATSETVATIKIDGSSTVYPITEAIAKDFQADSQNQTKPQINVKFSGTTAGFEKFCAGETDISNASRPILQAEMAKCDQNGVRFMEFPIAYDALSIAVNPQNTWAKEITVTELKKLWEPSAQGKITKWNQLRPSWPDRPINLYGAGDKSGTFDYFTEAIVGKSRASRSDYTASEDDNSLVRGISQDPNALGYFGYAYYEENQAKIKVLPVNNILPSRETVEKSQYQPLSRPLFIYVNVQSAQKKAAVKEFVEYYLEKAGKKVDTIGYVPLPAEGYQLNYVHFSRGKVGTVYAGKSQIGLTMGELLRREGQF